MTKVNIALEHATIDAATSITKAMSECARNLEFDDGPVRMLKILELVTAMAVTELAIDKSGGGDKEILEHLFKGAEKYIAAVRLMAKIRAGTATIEEAAP
jgi:hypothetical protein